MMQSEMAIAQDWPQDKERAAAKQAEVQTLLLEHRQAVFHFCLGFARDRAAAQDLTQDTFLKAFSHWDRVPLDHIRPWLLCIARNAGISGERRRRVRRLFMPWLAQGELDPVTPEYVHGRDEDIFRVRRAISKLSLHLREVLVLREYNDLSYKEIADCLGLKPGTVMSRINRARLKILDLLREKNDEES